MAILEGNVCGNGVIESYNGTIEECDNADANGMACQPEYGDCVYCSENCTNVTVPGPYCGDGILDEPYEECDGEAGVGQNEFCRDDCTLETCYTHDGAGTCTVSVDSCECATEALDDDTYCYDTVELATDLNFPDNSSAYSCIDNPDNIEQKYFDCKGHTIQGPDFEFENFDGIYLSDKEEVTIKNCEITGFANGIYLGDSSNIRVENSEIHGNYRDRGGIHLEYTTASYFVNNEVYDNDNGFQLETGSDNNHFLMNTVYDNEFQGYQIGNSDHNEIRGGEVGNNNQGTCEQGDYCQQGGIWFGDLGSLNYDNSDHNTVTGVYMHNNKYAAIYDDEGVGNEILSNNIDENCGGQAGIYLFESEKTLIDGNNITNGTGYGVETYSADHVTITDNLIAGNSDDGIYMYAGCCSNHWVEGNTIRDNPGWGVDLYGEHNVTVIDNDFADNTNGGVRSRYGDEIKTIANTFVGGGYGVLFEDTMNGEISDNTISGFENDGIRLISQGETSFNTVSDNTVTLEEGDVGIRIADDNNNITGNTVNCLAGLYTDLAGIAIDGSLGDAEDNYFAGNYVGGCYYAFIGSNVNYFEMQGDSYHDGGYGMYLENVGDDYSEPGELDGPFINGTTFATNCEGARLVNAYAQFTGSTFTDNNPEVAEQCNPDTGLYIDGDSTAYVVNGDFSDNGDYAIFDDAPYNLFWRLTETSTCIDNNVRGFGWVVPAGGRLDRENCDVEITGLEAWGTSDFTDEQHGYAEFYMSFDGGEELYTGTVGGPFYFFEADFLTDNPEQGVIDAMVEYYLQDPTQPGDGVEGKWVDVALDHIFDYDNVTLKLWYTDEELELWYLDEASLHLRYYDEEAEEWVSIPGGVNTEENYVWGVTDHLSLYGIYGDSACGNGIKEWDEECDGTDFGGDTCQKHSFPSGHLICTSKCTLSPDGCDRGSTGGGGGGHYTPPAETGDDENGDDGGNKNEGDTEQFVDVPTPQETGGEGEAPKGGEGEIIEPQDEGGDDLVTGQVTGGEGGGSLWWILLLLLLLILLGIGAWYWKKK